MGKKAVILLAVCVLCGACDWGMAETLGRTTRDPSAEIPAVHSFVEEYTILVSWNEDEAADEYFLYRAADDSFSPQYTLVYQGQLTKYRDHFELSHEGETYLYRLGKRRGQKYFVDLKTAGKTALGVVSAGLIDKYEPNNSEGRATELSSKTLDANLYYYASNSTDHVSVYDEDWYYVDIAPQWKVQVMINDITLSYGGTYKRFRLIRKNSGGVEDVVSGGYVEILNTGNEAGRFYFRVYPAWDVFQSYPPGANSSGGFGAYTPYDIRIINRLPI